jgi:hypothetical protein
VRNKWTSGWDDDWFSYRVPMEQTTDVRDNGIYPLSCTMILLDYSMGVTFECGPGGANVAAFIEAARIIWVRSTVE